MGKVIRLEEEVYRKIAAGEVVERPLSVVKELVENSLDAGATRIRVSVEQGGKGRIVVEDNGEGFAPDDIEAAFSRHSTSKLRETTDLDKITTLGFRGEALPSILEVSRIDLKTADNDSGTGIRAGFYEGSLETTKGIPYPRGTTIEVTDLFSNFPVRRKFLKSDAAELNQIVQFLEQVALAHYQVGFELLSNSRLLFSFPGVNLASERIYQVFGKEFLDGLQEITGADGDYRLHGFVSRPQAGSAQKNRQYLIVNGRIVREKTVYAALTAACQPFLEKGRHPAAILYLQLPPAEVDVNIHPMKLEIRFLDGRKIFLFVKSVIESGLIGHPKTSEHSGGASALRPVFAESRPRSEVAGPPLAQQTLFEESFARPDDGFQLLGQYAETYIVIERNGELLVIDQHNARELFLFDTMMRETESGGVAISTTLFPVILELTHSEKNLLTPARLELLKTAGFEVNDLGGTTVEIRTYARVIDERRVGETIRSLLESEPGEWNQLEKVIAGVACKGSVKANHRLHAEEMRVIARDLFSLPNPFFCPHQRPTMVAFSLAEIEKLLRRR